MPAVLAMYVLAPDPTIIHPRTRPTFEMTRSTHRTIIVSRVPVTHFTFIANSLYTFPRATLNLIISIIGYFFITDTAFTKTDSFWYTLVVVVEMGTPDRGITSYVNLGLKITSFLYMFL